MSKVDPILRKRRVGNISFYERMGVPCVRMIRKDIKQTKATIVSSTLFGKGSALTKTLRNLLLPVMAYPKDQDMQCRFREVARKCLQAGLLQKDQPIDKLPFLTGFEFNPGSGLTEKLRIEWQVTKTENGLVLNIPELNPIKKIIAPACTQSILWRVTAAAVHLTSHSAAGCRSAELSMPYANTTVEQNQLLLELPPVKDSIVVLAVSIKYVVLKKGQQQLVTDKRWMPAGIVWAAWNG